MESFPSLSIWSGLRTDFIGTLRGLGRVLAGEATGERSMRRDEEGHRLFESAKLVRFIPRELAALEAQFPRRPEALQVRATLEQDEKQWDKLLLTAETLRQRCPWLVVGYRFGCTALRGLKRVDEAEALALAAIRRFPRCSGAYSDFALSASLRGDHAEAIRRWEIASRRFPTHMWTYLLHTRALFDIRDFDEADNRLCQAVQLWPEQWQAWLWYAEVEERRENWFEAGERWEEVIRVKPGEPAPYSRCARAFRRAGELESATAIISEGSYLFPADEAIRTEFAAVQAAGGKA